MIDILMTTLFIVILIRAILKNRKILKKLTKYQIFGVVISYLITVFIAFIFIYYGGNWVVEYF